MKQRVRGLTRNSLIDLICQIIQVSAETLTHLDLSALCKNNEEGKLVLRAMCYSKITKLEHLDLEDND